MMKSLLAGLLLAISASAFADSTVDYDIVFSGKKSGTMQTVIRDDGRRQVTLSYRDNGRGPDLVERIALLPEGGFRSYRQTGVSTFGAKVDERFELSGTQGALELARRARRAGALRARRLPAGGRQPRGNRRGRAGNAGRRRAPGRVAGR